MIKRTLGILLLALPAFGHDFWIEPSSFRPASGTVVRLDLRVGEHFKGDRIAVRPERIERLFARSASGDADLAPGAPLRISSPSTIVVYRGRPNRVELPAGKFESYLREEGLERVIGERKARGESGSAGREIFSRCAKALIGSEDQPIGLRLEIVRQGDGHFLVMHDGRPLSGALVVAMHRDGGLPLRARSDAGGAVSFPRLRTGVWLVKTVHMVRLPPSSGDADWESLWASLTFENG